jgi:hypothetical protein
MLNKYRNGFVFYLIKDIPHFERTSFTKFLYNKKFKGIMQNLKKFKLNESSFAYEIIHY